MSAPDFLGLFLGYDRSEEELDALLAFALKTKDLEAATAGMATKWWDYRFIHPGYCFFLYAHEYGKAVTNWRSMFGVNPTVRLYANEDPIIRPIRKGRVTIVGSGGDLSPPSYRTGMWRGMCFADAYGVPYDRWISLAFEFAFEHRWERMPSPAMLYGDEMVRFILDRWSKETADILRLPVDERYLPENYVGHPWQDAQHEWLVGLIQKRSRPDIALAQYLFREKRLPVELAVKRLGPDTVERAQRQALPL